MTRSKYESDIVQKVFFSIFNYRYTKKKKKNPYPLFFLFCFLFWTELNAGQFILAASICSNWCMKPVAATKLGPGHFWLPPAWGHAAVASHTKAPSFSHLPQTTVSQTAKSHCFAWQECHWPMLQVQILFLLTCIFPCASRTTSIKMVDYRHYCR